LSLAACLVGCLVLPPVPGAASAGAPADRLDRFREIAQTRLVAADLVGGERAHGLYQEIYTLLDEEIVESLASGGVFASEGFLQDRLDAFNQVWGGAALHVMKTGAMVVAAIRLADAGEGNSIRVYAGRHGEAALLAAIEREGTPTLYPMPFARGEVPQVLVVWTAARSGRGTTPLRIDLVRHERDSVRTVWSTVGAFGGDVETWSHTIRGLEITLRYEVQYPGWVPGCDGQTEQEDLYRYVPAPETFTLVRRRVERGWHREFRLVVHRLFGALHAADRRALAELVPDERLRALVPPGLEPDAACDALDGDPPSAINVAAALGAERQPWALTFRRAGPAWRLVAAEPVIR
jgi:hypothetical protein